jgi:hypothetical protein
MNDDGQRAFGLDEARAILARTPRTLDAMLRDLPAAWAMTNEGPGTWTPFDVVGHLTHADRTNWLSRARTILEHGDARSFDAFDREGQFKRPDGETLAGRLDEFAAVRRESLDGLDALHLTSASLARTGRHPQLGAVTLGELLAAWVVHDLDHISQITRVLALQYGQAVGPWRTLLRVIRDARPAGDLIR